MKNWFNKNYRTIIILSFLIPIITVAVVSISHVTKWYGISNPVTWSIYLSVGIEIAALSSLAAISANMGKKVYFPFGIVTLIQFIGNIYFAHSYIDINSAEFKSWVELVSPLVEFMGVDVNDYVGHKRFLSFFAGGMLPIISLTFLHMLVKFTQENKSETPTNNESIRENTPVIDAKDIMGEVSKVRLDDEDLEKLERFLNSKQKTEEKLVVEEPEFNKEPEKKTLVETEPEIQQPVVEETPVNNEDEIVNKWENNQSLEGLTPMNEESPIIDLIQPNEPQIIEEPTSTPTSTPIPEPSSTPEPTTTPTPTPSSESIIIPIPEPSSTPEPTTTPTPTPSSESIMIPTPEPTMVIEEEQNIETLSNDDEEKKNY
jgi:hypothetical protein